MPTLDQIIFDKENFEAPITKYEIDITQGVTTDMLDCDGVKRIATIIPTTKSAIRPKVSISKLFSPIISTSRPTGQVSNSGVDHEANSCFSKKRQRLSSSYSLLEKRMKRSAKLALEDLLAKAMEVKSVNHSSKVYDSCPEVAEKVRKRKQLDPSFYSLRYLLTPIGT
jgi:hypothetical protein